MMRSSRRLLLENIASLAVLQGLNYAAPLITLPYLVRVLQPSHFGLLSFAQGIVLYFNFFTDFGFNFTQTRVIAICRHSPEALSRIFWTTLYAKTVLMCISAVALTVLVVITPRLHETPSLYAVNFLYVVGTTFFPIWFFQGLEKLKIAAGLLGTARLFTIPALLLFVRHPEDYVTAAAIQASVEVLASLLAWPLLFRRMALRWRPPSVLDIKTALKQAWPFFLSSSAAQISTSSTVVILGFTAGRAEVAYFATADKLIKASIAALSPLNQALYPHLTAARLRSAVSALSLIRKTLFLVIALALTVSAFTALLAAPACHLILGKSFEHSIAVLRCLSPLPVLFGLTAVLGTQTMLVFGMDALFCKIMLLSSAVGLPLTIALSFMFGSVGAALASVMTMVFMVTAMSLALWAKGICVWQPPSRQPSPLMKGSCEAT